MKMKYEPNYKGYFYINRAVLKVLITKKQLSFSQLGSLIYFISQIDFDKKHKNYSKLIRDDDVMAKSLGLSTSTIYKQRKELAEKGLFAINNNITTFESFFLFRIEYASFFSKMNDEQLQHIFDNPQKGKEIIKVRSEKSHSNEPEITDPFNLSSKENVGLSDDDIEINDDDFGIDFQEGGDEHGRE